MLTGTGVIALVGENTYAHTPKSMAYLEGAAVDFFNLWYHSIIKPHSSHANPNL
jgi:hypothetical protein